MPNPTNPDEVSTNRSFVLTIKSPVFAKSIIKSSPLNGAKVKAPAVVVIDCAPMKVKSSSIPIAVAVDELKVGIALLSKSIVSAPLLVSPEPVKMIDPLSASPISIVSPLAPAMSPPVIVRS